MLAIGEKLPLQKTKTRLSVLLKGEYCAEICKSSEHSPICSKEGDCKRSLVGWFPLESFRNETAVSFRQFYPKRKWNLLRDLPETISNFCAENQNWDCGENRIGSGKNSAERRVEIRINGFERRIHWSLYAASFSLLLLPGYFHESMILDIDYFADGKHTSVIISEKPNWNYWFGWIFFPWGPFASASDEKLFLESVKALSQTFTKGNL